MKSVHILIILVVSIILFTCKENETGPAPASIELSVVDVGATEAWLHIQAAGISSSEVVVVKRDGQTFTPALSSPLDTVILDEGLLPKHSYTYKAYRYINTILTDSSKALPVTLMDTTSHNFSWQTFTLGGAYQSRLLDVTIADENNIWAVGLIWAPDADSVITYNAVHWDGNNVELVSIPSKFWNTNSYYVQDLRAIYSASPNNLCVSIGESVVWFDGSHWGNDQYLFSDVNDTTFGGLNKFAGFGISQVFGAGSKGNLFSYSGNSWSRISNGTTSPIIDLCAVLNKNTQKQVLYYTATDYFSPNKSEILKLTDGIIDSISWDKYRDGASSIWTFQGLPIYVVGGEGLYQNLTGTWNKINFGTTNFYPSKVRGTGLNNIIVIDAYKLVAHFNGVDWRILPYTYDGFNFAVAIKGSTVATVGIKDKNAILRIGKQN